MKCRKEDADQKPEDVEVFKFGGDLPIRFEDHNETEKTARYWPAV